MHSIDDLISRTGQDPFGNGGVLAYERIHPAFVASLANPSKAPDLREFRALRERYIAVFNSVMDGHQLDALVFPQSLSEAPLLLSDANIMPTSISPINIGGFPGISLPAGYYPSGTPFGIIILGRLWDEARALRLAYAYEQQTRARRTPKLVLRPAELNHPESKAASAYRRAEYSVRPSAEWLMRPSGSSTTARRAAATPASKCPIEAANKPLVRKTSALPGASARARSYSSFACVKSRVFSETNANAT